MKDALLNLLVFLLVFLLVAAVFLANYAFAMLLVPGGKGLVFANPFAGALLPALLGGLLAALYRSVRRPGRFAVTWTLQAVAFFLLLTLPLPLFQQMPSLRAADASPLVTDRFLPLENGSLLLATSAQSTLLIPSDGGLMTVSPVTQYDAMNQRFVLSDGPPLALGSTSLERGYFQYTAALVSLQTDLLGLYVTLRDSLRDQPLVFWFQAAAITWLFLGYYFFFSFKTWPLVQLVLVLLLLRLGIMFVVYAFWSVPLLVDLWWPGSGNAWLRTWAPIGLIGAAAASLFFMTVLSKPHHREVLS